MPIFYFHQRKKSDLVVDAEGGRVATIADARQEAIEAARELMSERVRFGRPEDGLQFEITDSDGKIVTIVTFAEAIRS